MPIMINAQGAHYLPGKGKPLKSFPMPIRVFEADFAPGAALVSF